MSTDVAVVGTGIIGLTTSLALADRGIRVSLIGTSHSGEASVAAAGMLTPCMEPQISEVLELARSAARGYPQFVSEISRRSGITIPVRLNGALRIAYTENDLAELTAAADSGMGTFLTQAEALELEPDTRPGLGAFLYEDCGCVEPVPLMQALRMVVAGHNLISVISEDVIDIDLRSSTIHLSTNIGTRLGADSVVLAAGAWTSALIAHHRDVPIRPIRGQIGEFGAPAAATYPIPSLQRVIYANGGYLVPRTSGGFIVGSTAEDAGFVNETTAEGLESIKKVTAATLSAYESPTGVLPGPQKNRLQSHFRGGWAGLRPVTPDFLPIIGPDPKIPNLFYAAGHSRNGILLGPVTGELITDLITGKLPGYDLYRFRPERF